MSGSVGGGNGLEVGRHYMFRRIGVRSGSAGSGSGSGGSGGSSGSGGGNTPAAILLGNVCPGAFYQHVPLRRVGVRGAGSGSGSGSSGSGSGNGDTLPAAAMALAACDPGGGLAVGSNYLFKRVGKREGVPAAVTVCPTCGSGSGARASGAGSGSGSGSGINYVPCSVIESIGGATITLDWEVATCFAGTGSVAWTGAACSPTALFNAGTGNIFAGADTSFDPTDVLGPIILFQWCDGENTLWVSNADYGGLIEFALCCVSRSDGSTYLALYALLTLGCGNGVPVGVTAWAYKTREIAYVPGDPFVLSITGLTPFASDSGGAGCSCGGSPEISLALTVDLP